MYCVVYVVCIILITKKPVGMNGLLYKMEATTYSPTTAVPSAWAGLTSLFGMGRGGHRCYRHLPVFSCPSADRWHILKDNIRSPSHFASAPESYGLLVLLDFDIAAFTSATYPRHSLRRPLPSEEVADLILGGVSRLDAFSVYLVPT